MPLLHFGIDRKFRHLDFQVPPGLPVWKFRKNLLKHALRKGVSCRRLAEFRCGVRPHYCRAQCCAALWWYGEKFS